MEITRHTPLEQLPEFLTPEELQAFLGLSRAAAYERMKSPELRASKIGRLWRVPRAALVALAEPRMA